MNIAFNQSYADVEIATLQQAIIAEYPPKKIGKHSGNFLAYSLAKRFKAPPPYIELMIERDND